MKSIVITILALLFLSCSDNNHQEHSSVQIKADNPVFTKFDSIPKSKVMVVGSYHFRQEKGYDELSAENQKQIKKLVDRLAEFEPTKVVIEKQPQYDSIFQDLYQKYILDHQVIDTLENETFQLGFRLAKLMGHKKVYLFDNQTEFIGSLEGFTWEKFGEETARDSLFVNRHLDIIMESFNENQEKLSGLSLYDNIMERNSPEAQKWNAQRMHAYEVRTGIQESWMGPDWLGRWYQRNIRMMANIMSFDNQGKDRILIIAGDNHKWVLDTLLGFNPDFEVVSSYELLKPR
ncbi:DUF5694 domain-containing protein [Winogradskyella sp.]|uniref:DUF5694 domain-containing protein n=1 Tax=Winogradskyella sp. TaxID=1883156 RepID=UPI003BA917A5